VQQRILAFLAKNPLATGKEIALGLEDISESGVKYNLKVLQKKEPLRHVVPDNGKCQL